MTSLSLVPPLKKIVKFYTVPSGCVQCAASKRYIAKKNILVLELDGTLPENRELAHSLGHMQAPVFTVTWGDEIVDHWAGFNPNKLDELAADPLVEFASVKDSGLVA